MFETQDLFFVFIMSVIFCIPFIIILIYMIFSIMKKSKIKKSKVKEMYFTVNEPFIEKLEKSRILKKRKSNKGKGWTKPVKGR